MRVCWPVVSWRCVRTLYLYTVLVHCTCTLSTRARGLRACAPVHQDFGRVRMLGGIILAVCAFKPKGLFMCVSWGGGPSRARTCSSGAARMCAHGGISWKIVSTYEPKIMLANYSPACKLP
eukprot:4023741-Pyramimonas_sp.AAC.1